MGLRPAARMDWTTATPTPVASTMWSQASLISGRAKNRLVVEGVNIIKRHTKPNPQRNIKGGVVEREASVHASNVQLLCPECGKQTRVGRKVLGDGRKVRICRKCEGVVDK